MSNKKPISPKLEFDKIAYCASVPRDVNGLPVFSNGRDKTYWTLALGWSGEITIDGIEYRVVFGPKHWIVVDRKKKELPTKVHTVLIDLFKEFKKVYDNEKEITRELRNERGAEARLIAKESGKLEVNKKAMLAQHQIQLNEVYAMIVEGKTRYQIINTLKEKYGYTERRISQIIGEANTTIIKNVELDRGSLVHKNLAKLDDLYQRNLEKDDTKECRLIIETIQKMLALNQTEKKEVEIKKTVRFTFDTPELPVHTNSGIQDVPYEFVKSEGEKILNSEFKDEISDDELLREFDGEKEENEDSE